MPSPTHEWHIPAGTAPAKAADVHLDPRQASLQWCGVRVHALDVSFSLAFTTGNLEMCVLPQRGAVRVEVEGHTFLLRDRTHVFHAIADWAYLPIDTEVRITAVDGPALVALPSAIADRKFSAVKIDAEAVPVELRGAGQATRQVNNFMAPEVFDGAQRLMCVEVITPDGNWSSYPPHRHDGIGECPANNEELYYFRIGQRDASGTVSDTGPGFGMHRTYTVAGDVDVNVPVYDGDVFLIPRGYHGPCVAAPGYPMYYLNVLSGPSGERTMAFCDDPAHHWIRDTWADVAPDPRLPMTSAKGPVHR